MHKKFQVNVVAAIPSTQAGILELFKPGVDLEIIVTWPSEDAGVRLTIRASELPSSGPKRYLKKLELKRSRGKTLYLDVCEVDWIEAANQYARVHTPEGSYLTRESMSHLEKCLDPEDFARVHRSTIVNLDRVRGFEMESPANSSIILVDGTRINVTKSRWEDLRDIFLWSR